MQAPVETPTSLGPVWMWGQDTGRPAVLIITGMFENAYTFERTHTYFREADVFYAHLPGNHSPHLADLSVGSFGQAFSEAIDSRFADRPVLVTGISAGALVALSIRAANVAALLLVEPPLRNQYLWPLLSLRQSGPPDWEVWARSLFGISATTVEARDYTPLLKELRVPTTVLIGDDPLQPRRAIGQMPSLVDEQSRQRLREHPSVTIVDLPGVGHNVVRFAPHELLSAMQDSLRRAMEGWSSARAGLH